MNKTFTLLALCIFSMSLNAQDLIEDLEHFQLQPNTYLNGSDLSGGFEISGGFLPNSFDTTFQSWTGWAISSMQDTITEGYGNQYSAIAGSGADGSQNYAVSYHFLPNTMQVINNFVDAQAVLRGLQITNGTYPYLSMLNGDGFAKKFGGADGNDPDYFLLTIRGINSNNEADSVLFYLADYTFEDNTMDYIVKDWTYVDLSSLSNSEVLTFELSSTDVGMFGVNTPTYFCIDNIEYDLFTSTQEEVVSSIAVHPNPTSDFLHFQTATPCQANVFDAAGRLMRTYNLQAGGQSISLQDLPKGIYNLVILTGTEKSVAKFIKQ